MKILVAVKRVVDPNVRISVRPDGGGVALDNVKMVLNPFCEIAVEAAIRLREAGTASEVIVASIGPAKAEDGLRAALAMGADRAIHVLAGLPVEPLVVAKLLAALAREEGAGLALLGKQAIDDDANQTGQMLAALLDWPQATFASAIHIAGGEATVTREIETGAETLALTLPAVITTDLRLNAPRFAALPAIMKARAKPLRRASPADFGIDIAPRLKVLATEAPPPRAPGTRVANVAELVERLAADKAI